MNEQRGVFADFIGLVGVGMIGAGLSYISLGATLAWIGFVCILLWATVAAASRR